MVKTVDPDVKVIVGEFAGINIYDFSNASDWSSIGENYDWFPALLLDTLKKASDAFGAPLVDIFSFHFYPQHKIDANGDFSKTGTTILRSSSTTDISRKTRMNFTRSLWDETYIEPSWLTGSKLSGASNMILKRLQETIDTYFPSVKMMIGEFDYGDDNDISHGIGMVDFLGACGQYGVEIATRWDLNPYNGVTYTNSAYQLFQNFDGANNTFGNQSVFSSFDNREKGSVWGSLNEDGSELHLIIINKEVSNTVSFTISHNEPQKTYSFNSNYAFDPSKKAIQNIGGTNINVTNTSTSCTLQPMNAYHLVLNRSDMITNLDKDQSMLMNIEVFPNPVSALVQISSVVGNITLKDLSGTVLITKQNTDHIDIRSLAAGNYLVTITSGGKEFTRKIVKQ
jgi:mannan endo-1,4-beta-mannosidase